MSRNCLKMQFESWKTNKASQQRKSLTNSHTSISGTNSQRLNRLNLTISGMTRKIGLTTIISLRKSFGFSNPSSCCLSTFLTKIFQRTESQLHSKVLRRTRSNSSQTSKCKSQRKKLRLRNLRISWLLSKKSIMAQMV